MHRAQFQLRICAAATHDPLDAHTFSGLSAQLFRALMRRGASVRTVQTRTLTLRELRAGALDLRPLGRGQRPRIRATWQWSHAACARQSDRASATIADWDIDAVLQVGTHVRIDHSTAARACITDATVLQAVRANRFSVARTARVEEAVRWQHEVFTNQDRIFVLSDWAAQSVIHDYGIPASRVVVTGAGANLDHVPTRTNTAPMLLFVGRDWEHKGGPAIVDAFRIARREVPDLELIVVGCQPNLQEPGVTVVGTLRRTHPEEHAALHAYYGAARAFVLCPDFDAFPNVLLEAQASGVPVISYNDGSRPEAVQHGETGLLVERGDTTALAQAFVVLGRDPVLAAAMGTSAQMRAEQHFTWPGVARHILEELASATNTYSRRS